MSSSYTFKDEIGYLSNLILFIKYSKNEKVYNEVINLAVHRERCTTKFTQFGKFYKSISNTIV